VDLRTQPCPDVIDRVERCLGARMDRQAAVVKRRSVGGRTDRDTWLRLEARPFARLTGQGSGVEATAWREYQADLGSRSGLVSQVFFCAEIIAAGDDYAGPLAKPTRREATRLISSLQ
jgi:hypothetical protein